jgi:hypothetical protein
MAKLTEIEKTILDLLSNALFDKPLNNIKDIDWNALYEEARVQSVFPLIYSVAEEHIPDDKKAQYRQINKRIISNNIRVDYEHSELHQLMTDNKIPYVAMKGSASALYYPQPYLRTMGDVDFMINKDDLNCTGKILEALGFVPEEHNENEAHIAYFRNSTKSVWEMHWSLYGIPDSNIGELTNTYLSDLIDTAHCIDNENGTYMIPDTFHHGLIMLIHTAGHMINTGIGLRHLCDWAVFVNSLSNDEFVQLFEEKLKAIGLWHFAQLLTQLSIKYLSCEEKIWAMEDINDELLETMMEDIFEGGNFGIKDEQRINQAKLITNKGKGNVDNTSLIKQLINTMNEKARIGMPITKKIPLLLPIGWFYVGIRHLIRILSGKRPKIKVNEMIEGATKRKEIYKQFHLFEK